MRYVYGVLCVLLLLFVIVQYNDPDGPAWMVIYGVPGLLAGYSAWRPDWIRQGVGRTVLLVCLVLSIAGTVYYWPTTPGFWRQDVWWNTETAREGMGMMIVTIVLLIMALPALLGRRNIQP